MEIKNVQGVYNTYKKTGSANVSSDKKAALNKAENVDKLEFDFTRAIDAARANVASNIDAEKNTSRIEQLQAMYQGDSCPVSAEEVANAIISGQ